MHSTEVLAFSAKHELFQSVVVEWVTCPQYCWRCTRGCPNYSTANITMWNIHRTSPFFVLTVLSWTRQFWGVSKSSPQLVEDVALALTLSLVDVLVWLGLVGAGGARSGIALISTLAVGGRCVGIAKAT